MSLITNTSKLLVTIIGTVVASGILFLFMSFGDIKALDARIDSLDMINRAQDGRIGEIHSMVQDIHWHLIDNGDKIGKR